MGQELSGSVVWKAEGLDFVGSVGSGYEFEVSAGPNKTGAGPMELLLTSLAGCTAADVVGMLKKQRQEISGVEVEARGVRADAHPRVYTDVMVTYVIRGKDVDPKAVERAITLSEEKYCSVSAMICRSGTNLDINYRIEEG
jgi:putative redox protein